MRRRVLRLALTAALSALVVFGLPLAFAVRLVYLSDETSELTRVAERAAAAVPVDALTGAVPLELPRGEGDTAVAVYNAHGQRVAGHGPSTADEVVRAAISGHLADTGDGGHLLVAVPIRDGEAAVGAARASSPRRTVRRRTALTWLLMAGLGTLSLGAAAVLARRQSVRLTRPLADLASAAAALGDGDFTVHAAASGITEIDTAAAALNHTAARLGDMLRRERAFSAAASHQLRTPLTGLRLVLEAALDGGAAPLRTAAVRAIDAADLLERTVEDLLTMTRGDTPDRGPLDIGAVLDDLYRERSPALAVSGRSLQAAADTSLPPVTASAMAVRQILAVLLDNAARHGAGAIGVRARDAGEAVAIDVCDEGAGPPPVIHGGADSGGMGLALARTLAEAEGGRLTLTRPGPGPIFTLFLPAQQD